MPTRGEVRKYKPTRSEGWALCRGVYAGRCTCEANRRGPCSAWLMTLRHCFAHRLDPVTYELDRVKRQQRV